MLIKEANVLMIGADMRILEEGCDSNDKIKEYGKLINRLDVIIYNGSIFGGRTNEVFGLSENVFAYPVSFFDLLFRFRNKSKKLCSVLSQKVHLVTSQDPFHLGFVGMIFARKLHSGFQAQIHTDIFSPYFKKESLKNRIKVWLARKIIARADGVRVVSNKIKDSLKRELKLNVEPFVLPVWVPADKLKDSPALCNLKEKYPQFETIFLMASRITVEKNINIAILAMKNVVKRFGKVGLVIVGEGPLKKNYELLIANYELENNIKFEPWTNDLPSYYKTSDLFINTSNYEGYGRTIVESLICGTPVVTTDVGCAMDVIENNKNGAVISAGGKNELEDFLTRFLSDLHLQENLKKGASEYVSDFKNKEDYLEAYGKSWAECLK